MKLGYTEFSYGYGFTENLIRSSAQSPTGAPYFPNLVQEATLGFDVRIDLPACPLFFQFKLPELMVRETAKEILQHNLPLACNFFRMPLMRTDLSDQHNLLMQLEHTNAGLVFYASPVMEDIDAFSDAYNVAEIHRQSAFFSPLDIGPLPSGKHVVSYMANSLVAWRCSEPKEVKALPFEKLLPRLTETFADPQFARLEAVADRLPGTLRELRGPAILLDEGAIRARVRARLDGRVADSAASPRQREVIEELLATREIARIGFGLEMIVAQPRA